tara:strand:+ start:259 stop:465 length:207 start_codon:yes stop_codon:yes gene_type:complete
MKVDGRTKFGKSVNKTKKGIGLISKIFKFFTNTIKYLWLVFYLPAKHLVMLPKHIYQFLKFLRKKMKK